MAKHPELTSILRDTIIGSVSADAPDLTLRQLAVLLICCLDEPLQTVRGLAKQLNVSKPAISRAADRLSELGFAERRDDKRDRRSVLLVATPAGRAYVRGLRDMLVAASRATAATDQA